MQFYGMGEKMKGFELSGVQTKFWNTDIFADFHWNSVDSGNEERLSDEDRQEARRLRQFLFEEMARTPVEVRDIMTPSVVSVDELTKVTDISDLMMYEHLHRVFVRRAGDIVGIVTTYDMLKVISDPVLTGRLWRTDD